VPCVIVFGGNDQEPLTLELDVDERVIWVNPQNVLYVEDASIPSTAE
jgi:hypothetical protein